MSLFPKPKAPPPPPSTPTKADASVIDSGQQANAGIAPSLVSSGAATGLKKKASTVKSTLLGGGTQ